MIAVTSNARQTLRGRMRQRSEDFSMGRCVGGFASHRKKSIGKQFAAKIDAI